MFINLIIGLTLSFFVGKSAQARPIVDIFECRAKINYLITTEATEVVSVIAANREASVPSNSISQRSVSEEEITKGEARLSLELDLLTTLHKLDYKIRYGFVKSSRVGGAKAQQYVCNDVYFDGCFNGGGCVNHVSACHFIDGPFTPENGWNETSLSQGVPIFNEKLLRPVDIRVLMDIRNERRTAHVTVNCKLQGTHF